jgi:DNA-binding HxlR family transcriptional regulator
MSQIASHEESVWRMLGKRWTYLILCTLSARKARFGELKRLLSGISGTVLSERLVQLENEGLVTRTVHDDKIPPKVEYSLTESAKELESILSRFASSRRTGNLEVMMH